MAATLDAVLTYMEKLGELDTASVEPTPHVLDVTAPLREDRVANTPDEQLLANAPARDGMLLPRPEDHRVSAPHDLSIREAGGVASAVASCPPSELTRGALARIAATEPRPARLPHGDGRRRARRRRATPTGVSRAGDGARRARRHPRRPSRTSSATAGVRTTAGSRILERFVAAVRRHRDARACSAAGAVLVGKANCDEFAMGSSTENSAYGPTRNPWDRRARAGRLVGRLGGGGRGARSASAALGTDTGGSIRLPGVVLRRRRPEADLRAGQPLRRRRLRLVARPGRAVRRARRATARCVLEAIAGHDPRDSTSVAASGAGLRAALATGASRAAHRPPARVLRRGHAAGGRATRCAPRSSTLERLGATVEDVSLPHTEYAIATYYLVATAEASSNLARYDGIRYGTARRPPAAACSRCTGRRAPRASAPR